MESFAWLLISLHMAIPELIRDHDKFKKWYKRHTFQLWWKRYLKLLQSEA